MRVVEEGLHLVVLLNIQGLDISACCFYMLENAYFIRLSCKIPVALGFVFGLLVPVKCVPLYVVDPIE